MDDVSANNGSELHDSDLSRLADRPRPLNMERQRSFDERSLTELSIGFSSRNTSTPIHQDHLLDNTFSPGPARRSGFNTPTSNQTFDPHPIVAEAWEALRRSLVYFRGQPVGTIAALDNSEADLNYDQVYLVPISVH